MKNNKIVVYTAIFGDKDEVREPPLGVEGVDFVCFTDNPNMKSETFDVRVVDPELRDPTRNARMYKVLAHKFLPEYKYSIWIDGNVVFKTSDIKGLISEYLDSHDMALFIHPDRSCIYQEADACIALKKEDPEKLKKQARIYRQDGYPEKHGLVMTTVVLRRHTPGVIEVNEQWWEEMNKHTRRDQMSFNYVAWKNGLNYEIIKENAYENDIYRRVDHKVAESASSFQEVIEIKNREIEELKEKNEELNYGILKLAIHRAKKRIRKYNALYFKELFTKASRTIKRDGFLTFLKYCYKYAFHGRGYFKYKDREK